VEFYHPGKDYYGDEKYLVEDSNEYFHPWTIRNFLNWGWIIVTFSTLFFIISGFILKLEKDSDFTTEVHEQIFKGEGG
jgi:hypothetical protein